MIKTKTHVKNVLFWWPNLALTKIRIKLMFLTFTPENFQTAIVLLWKRTTIWSWASSWKDSLNGILSAEVRIVERNKLKVLSYAFPLFFCTNCIILANLLMMNYLQVSCQKKKKEEKKVAANYLDIWKLSPAWTLRHSRVHISTLQT